MDNNKVAIRSVGSHPLDREHLIGSNLSVWKIRQRRFARSNSTSTRRSRLGIDPIVAGSSSHYSKDNGHVKSNVSGLRREEERKEKDCIEKARGPETIARSHKTTRRSISADAEFGDIR